jgi:hypothetical protein
LEPPWQTTAYRLWRHRHWSYCAIADLLNAEGWEVTPLEVAASVDELSGRQLRAWLSGLRDGR